MSLSFKSFSSFLSFNERLRRPFHSAARRLRKASQEELKEDYRDFLRTRGLAEWPETHRYAQRLRELNRRPGAAYKDFQKGIESDDPEIAGNVMLGLVKVTVFLLKRQLESLEKAFLKEGGLRERMTAARLKARGKDRRD